MTVAVLGVGLIGGSLALAVRDRLDEEVVGWDGDPHVAQTALERGVVTAIAQTVGAAVDGTHTVIIAAPVGAIADVGRAALDAAAPDTVVTDVGSVKEPIVAALGADERFIGGHPLAGAEVAGVEHARVDLVDGAVWYLTPTEGSNGVLFERLHRFIVSLGARPQTIDAEAHDRVLAAVSHLPHILANVLVEQAAGALGGEAMPATGPSFRDATRVAGANPRMWADIYEGNRIALAEQLDATIARLQHARDHLDDREAMAAWQTYVARERDRLFAAGLAGGATHELRVSVSNTPGVVAQLALALGRAGVNILDIRLSPSADQRTGVVALWVAAGRGDQATGVLQALGHEVTP